MLDSIEVFRAMVRPTGEQSTECRSYKHFYDNRYRTESYPQTRFAIIYKLGIKLKEATNVLLSEESTKTKNIDVVALEFARCRHLENSLEIYYSLIEWSFKNLKRIEADYFTDPEIRGQEGIVFKILIKDKTDNILEEEEKLYSNINKMIPIEEQKYFSLVYQVI